PRHMPVHSALGCIDNTIERHLTDLIRNIIECEVSRREVDSDIAELHVGSECTFVDGISLHKECQPVEVKGRYLNTLYFANTGLSGRFRAAGIFKQHIVEHKPAAFDSEVVDGQPVAVEQSHNSDAFGANFVDAQRMIPLCVPRGPYQDIQVPDLRSAVSRTGGKRSEVDGNALR